MTAGLLRLLRPTQWTKNGLCLAGVVFSGYGQHLWQAASLRLAVQTFGVFCLVASSVYVLNDVLDRERDRRHPKKRARPIASGAVSPAAGAALGVALFAAGGLWAWALGPGVWGCAAVYVATNIAYSAGLKHVVLLDVLIVAFGFVLRLLAGILVLGELPTSWILLCTFFLAMFLAFGKRRAELANLGGQRATRPSLDGYTLNYLDGLVNGAGIMAIVSYALYTVFSGLPPALVFTVPVVYYAISHYQRRLLRNEYGEEPDAALIRDPGILAALAVWIVLYLVLSAYPLDLVLPGVRK